MAKRELRKVLELHKKWLCSEGKEGKIANLSWADLSWANLSKANLSKANLSNDNINYAKIKKKKKR